MSDIQPSSDLILINKFNHKREDNFSGFKCKTASEIGLGISIFILLSGVLTSILILSYGYYQATKTSREIKRRRNEIYTRKSLSQTEVNDLYENLDLEYGNGSNVTTITSNNQLELSSSSSFSSFSEFHENIESEEEEEMKLQRTYSKRRADKMIKNFTVDKNDLDSDYEEEEEEDVNQYVDTLEVPKERKSSLHNILFRKRSQSVPYNCHPNLIINNGSLRVSHSTKYKTVSEKSRKPRTKTDGNYLRKMEIRRQSGQRRNASVFLTEETTF